MSAENSPLAAASHRTHHAPPTAILLKYISAAGAPSQTVPSSEVGRHKARTGCTLGLESPSTLAQSFWDGFELLSFPATTLTRRPQGLQAGGETKAMAQQSFHPKVPSKCKRTHEPDTCECPILPHRLRKGGVSSEARPFSANQRQTPDQHNGVYRYLSDSGSLFQSVAVSFGWAKLVICSALDYRG